jgi:hypothetical protein
VGRTTLPGTTPDPAATPEIKKELGVPAKTAMREFKEIVEMYDTK